MYVWVDLFGIYSWPYWLIDTMYGQCRWMWMSNKLGSYSLHSKNDDHQRFK